LVDDVVATSVAASVAQSANLPIANSVSNLAITTKVISDFAQNDASEVVKPQIVDSENWSSPIFRILPRLLKYSCRLLAHRSL